MDKQEMIEFLIESHRELTYITSKHPNIQSIHKWKHTLLPKLNGTSKIKINRIEIIQASDSSYIMDMYVDEHELKIAETILRDTVFKYTDKKTKENLEALKILKAREENIDFELELAEMICGDIGDFPYRSSMYLTEFFQNLGHNFTHKNETRRLWVRDRLEELNVKEIHALISKGLFRKKYFTDFNKDQRTKDVSFEKAVKEFNEFMQNSLTANEPFDLAGVLNMNVNIELLFDQKANTDDIELNKLIEEARERFLKNDKQVALEKLWGAFERIKTYYSGEGLNKRLSADKLVNHISENFDKELIDREFTELKDIGNGYRIRHQEIGKKELTLEHRNYFFFRMLSLIDLCLLFLNKTDTEEPDLF